MYLGLINQVVINSIVKAKPELYGTYIDEDDNLSDDLGVDSLDAVEIVTELERSLNITIPDSMIDKIKLGTVRDAEDIVAKIKADFNPKTN